VRVHHFLHQQLLELEQLELHQIAGKLCSRLIGTGRIAATRRIVRCDQTPQPILGLGGLFAVVYGAAVAGSEWTWGTLKSTVARGESRVLYMLMSFAGIAVILAIGLIVTFAIGVVAGALGATIAGIPLDGLSDGGALGRLPEQFLRGWVVISAEASIGFAVATLARSQLAGIGVGIALYFGEAFASIFLPDIVKYLPFDLATAAVGGNEGFGAPPDPNALSADLAFALITVWLIGSLVVAAGFTDRAEITG
jgi:hypothetical protein